MDTSGLKNATSMLSKHKGPVIIVIILIILILIIIIIVAVVEYKKKQAAATTTASTYTPKKRPVAKSSGPVKRYMPQTPNSYLGLTKKK